MGLKQEMETAMRLLEKDTHEKQDTLEALRLQLDQVKTLNLQMFHKAQVDACMNTPFFQPLLARMHINASLCLLRLQTEWQKESRLRRRSLRGRWMKWREP